MHLPAIRGCFCDDNESFASFSKDVTILYVVDSDFLVFFGWIPEGSPLCYPPDFF